MIGCQAVFFSIFVFFQSFSLFHVFLYWDGFCLNLQRIITTLCINFLCNIDIELYFYIFNLVEKLRTLIFSIIEFPARMEFPCTPRYGSLQVRVTIPPTNMLTRWIAACILACANHTRMCEHICIRTDTHMQTHEHTRAHECMYT